MQARVVIDIAIRCVRPEDAGALLDLKLALDAETDFMMLEPGERDTDVGRVADDIVELLASDNSMVFVADAGGELAGYVEARGGEFRRNCHAALLIAGVRQAYAGQGVGSRLFEALLDWSRDANIARLELTVMAHNTPAIRLYEKFGFKSEGTRRKSLRVAGAWVDEVAMARIMPDDFADSGSSE